MKLKEIQETIKNNKIMAIVLPLIIATIAYAVNFNAVKEIKQYRINMTIEGRVEKINNKIIFHETGENVVIDDESENKTEERKVTAIKNKSTESVSTYSFESNDRDELIAVIQKVGENLNEIKRNKLLIMSERRQKYTEFKEIIKREITRLDSKFKQINKTDKNNEVKIEHIEKYIALVSLMEATENKIEEISTYKPVEFSISDVSVQSKHEKSFANALSVWLTSMITLICGLMYRVKLAQGNNYYQRRHIKTNI
jgi:hypothetical protein